MTDIGDACRCSPSDQFGWPSESQQPHHRDEHHAVWDETHDRIVESAYIAQHQERGCGLTFGMCEVLSCDCEKFESVESVSERNYERRYAAE